MGRSPLSVPLRECRAVEEIVRRIGSLSTEMVALVGTSLACLVLVAGFAVAMATGAVRASDVAAALTFLLIVAVGLYASRLGAPGRST
jgi:hypothetical protein